MNTITMKIDPFSLKDTLECGQCFRFKPLDDGSFSGTALGRQMTLRQDCDTVRAFARDEESSSFAEQLGEYFALDVNYGEIQEILGKDEILRAAIDNAPGIRVLRQPLFETLISFILSQNNNIKRISGIIERLCEMFGSHIDGDARDFPAPETLAKLNPEQLKDVRCGFRDKYIIDAAQRWVSGGLDEDVIRRAPLGIARKELMKVFGVGPKVADCTLLFGASRFDAFPEDVWIKRAMSRWFPHGLPETAKPYAGIAQQYIFHYARTENKN